MFSRNFVRSLASARSATGGTSLITIQVPSGSNIASTNGMLAREISSAQNIKDKSVRKDVISSLKTISQNLASIRSIPQNRLVICAGIANAKSYF